MDRPTAAPPGGSSAGTRRWRTRGVRAACTLAGFVLLLTACGGSPAASGGSELTAAPAGDAGAGGASASWLAAELAADGSPLSSDQAACLATVLVEVLDDAGFLDPAAASSDDPGDLLTEEADLTSLDSDAMGAGVAGCGITFGVLIAEAMGGGVDDALVACLDAQFTPELIGQVLLADMTGAPIGDRSSEEVARGAALACANHLPDPSGDDQ